MSAIPGTLLQCARAVAQGTLPDCKPLGFTVVDWLTIIVSMGTIIGGLYWALSRLYRLLFTRSGTQIRDFKSLRDAIRPLMDDNSRIFSQFGPNSGVRGIGAVRFDLSVWKRVRATIGENNDKIAELIRTHRTVVPAHYRKSFDDWLSHIDAFSAHLADETVDYRHHQFPPGIPDIIRQG